MRRNADQQAVRSLDDRRLDLVLMPEAVSQRRGAGPRWQAEGGHGSPQVRQPWCDALQAELVLEAGADVANQLVDPCTDQLPTDQVVEDDGGRHGEPGKGSGRAMVF